MTGSNGIAHKRSRKSECHHRQQGAADQQEQDIFQSALARDLRRIGSQKHERAEGELFTRVTPNEMEQHRAGNGQAAEQEEWGEETHALAWR